MAGSQLETFLRRLRRVLRPSTVEVASDAQLLSRFVQQRDEEAFELLVWRHGLMVLNVCRRVLRHEHDAEDAFQATFLALASKAGAIGKRESVGSWLYKVAYRIALRAKKTVSLRPLTEELPPDPSSREPINDLLWREFGTAIDEEIQRLQEKYRAALVLCYLEGQTIESAAGILDCPPGTVGTWLARARTLLRRRLTSRGFDLSDATEARNIVAVLSAALVNSTVQAAVLGTVEQAAAAGMISTSAAALTKGALQAMSLTRWTATARTQSFAATSVRISSTNWAPLTSGCSRCPTKSWTRMLLTGWRRTPSARSWGRPDQVIPGSLDGNWTWDRLASTRAASVTRMKGEKTIWTEFW